MDNIPGDSLQPGRRLRVSTPPEQQEFVRLGRQLIEGGVTTEELQLELGYEEMDSLRSALQSGRVTTLRLQKLRELANQRLPDLLQQKSEAGQRRDEERMQRLMERFRQETSATRDEPAPQNGDRQTPKAATAPDRSADTHRAESGSSAKRRRGGAKPVREREFLNPRQHARLRDQIEHLWAVDKRFRNWSLLARVGALKSGQAMKRAYDVGSSVGTLKNVETFARLHAGYGSRATSALQRGIPIDELQAHLTRVYGAPGESSAAPIQPVVQTNAAPASPAGDAAPHESAAPAEPAALTLAGSDAAGLPATPPSFDFDTLLEIGAAVDVELRRMWHTARFFDAVSGHQSLPRIVRDNAAITRDHLTEAIGVFSVRKG